MKKPVKQLLLMLSLLSGFQMADAQTFIPLYSFTDGYDGDNPIASLVQASDGSLYGTTSDGGTNGYGTVFRITTSGTVKPLYSFTDGYDGADPLAGLVQANNNNLYGTAADGGTNGYGAIFRITTNGDLMPLYSFTGAHDGGDPRGGLVQAGDGNLYGTTTDGGTNFDGTVFELTLPPLSPPVLRILFSSHQSVLTWPAAAANYVLQSTTNLVSPNWVTISNITTATSFTVTNPLPGQHFRLANP